MSSSPSKHLLWVNSRPLPPTTDSQWHEWYTIEHIPDLVNHKASTRASFYTELYDFPGRPKDFPKEERKYLAIYQTEFEEPLKTKQYLDIRTTSEILPGEKIETAGEFNARNYRLVQDYDPKGLGQVTPKYLLTAEMTPNDEADFDAWYREEHLEMLSKVPGYRCSKRYKIGPDVPVLTRGEPPQFLAIHECDFLDGFGGAEAKELNGTEWTQRQMKGARVMVVRAWEKVFDEGF